MIALYPITELSQNKINCGLGSFDICINIADLTLVPCHRLAYPIYRGGKFIWDEEQQRLELIANGNFNGYLSLINYNNLIKPKCVSCQWNKICMKGCVGSQYEANGDPYIPVNSVCDLLISKYKFLITKYYEMGLFQYGFKYYPECPSLPIYKDLLKNMGFNDYGEK